MRTPLPLQCRAVLGIVLILVGCRDNTGPTHAGPPASLVQVTGDDQVGVVAQALSEPLVVRVVDANGAPLPNIRVEFRAKPGSGEAQTGVTSTDVSGLARTLWTLGPTARVAQRLDATVQGATAPSLTATFSATGTPDALTQLIKSGDTQVGALGAALAESLAVVAADRFGNGIAGVTITWTVSSGGGTVAALSATTDTLGAVKASWVLGPQLNVPHVVTASADGVSPATFSATALLPASAIITAFSGDAQRDTVGKVVAESLAARVTLAGGTPIEGATVAWAIAGGGGGITPATSATDRNGVAKAEWTLGTTVGDNAATATAAPLAAATFVAIGIPDTPASVTKVLGDDQHGVPGQLAPDSLAVVVSDQYGNVVPGTEVVFAIAVGDGGVSAARVMTDAVGRAAIAVRLGSTGVDNEVSVSTGNVPPVRFTISGTPGSDWALAIHAGDGQTTQTKGSITGLEVRLVDGHSRPVAGATVAWSAAGGGSPTATTTTTNADGIAANSWVVGCSARQTMTAAVPDLAPVSFEATVAQRAAYVAAFRRPSFGTQAYSSVALQVRIRDQVGCPVSGVEAPWRIVVPPDVTWPLAMKFETPAGPTSDSAGRIEYAFTNGGLRREQCATLPSSLTPYASDSTGYFCVYPTADVQSLAIDPPAAVLPAPGASVTLRAIARDYMGRALYGVAEWRITDTSIAGGVVQGYDQFRVTGRRVGTTGAVAEYIRTVGGQLVAWPTATASIQVRDTPGPAAVVSAGNLTDLVGSIGMAAEVIAYIKDASGNPVPAAVVTWALESGNGVFTTSSSLSDSFGEARTTFTPGPTSGSNIVTATVHGVGTARYLVWTPAANPVRIVVRRGDGQTGFVGHQLPEPISVRVEDEHGNGVYDQEVVFAVATGGGHVERTRLRTDTLGVAGTRWTPGALGTNTVSATWTGQSATFTATATSGGGLGIVMPNGSETWYSAPGQFPQMVAPPLTVRVVDDQGAPAAGVTVTWSVGANPTTTTVTDGAGLTTYEARTSIANPAVVVYTATVPGGATAVFSLIVAPSGGFTTCGPGIAGPNTAPVGTRLPGPVVVACFSNRGATVTSVTVSVTGGFLMPVPGYRPPVEWRYYWVMPNAPGTYQFTTSGYPGTPQSISAIATP